MDSKKVERLVPVTQAGRDFDIEFRHSQGDQAIFAAARPALEPSIVPGAMFVSCSAPR